MVALNRNYLDTSGLATLWSIIIDNFALRWNAYKPKTTVSKTTTSNSIVFESSASDTQKINGLGENITVTLSEATESTAGILSSADKQKLNKLNKIIEDAITLKTIKVGQAEEVENENIRELVINTADKSVNWDFVYNSTTNTLDIIDVNRPVNNNVMTSVSINDFIGDALISGILTDSDVVDKDGDNNSGSFIKLTFITTTLDGVEDKKDIYVNVADLIDIYNAGAGISLDPNGVVNADGRQRESTIKLKIASTTERGGFVATKVTNDTTSVQNTTIATRYFGVEIGKDNKAIVNVPIGTISAQNNSISGAVNISPITGGTTNIITGMSIVEKTDNTGHNVTPIGTTLNITKESEITWSDDSTSSNSPQFGDTLTVLTEIASDETGVNGHKIKRSKTSFTLPKVTITDTAVEEEHKTLITNDSNSKFEFDTITDLDINESSGVITATKTSFSFGVEVSTIEESFITSLTYIKVE